MPPMFPVLMTAGRWETLEPIAPRDAAACFLKHFDAVGPEKALVQFAGHLLAWIDIPGNAYPHRIRAEMVAIVDTHAGFDRAAWLRDEQRGAVLSAVPSAANDLAAGPACTRPSGTEG